MKHQVIEGTEKEIIRLQEELGKAKLGREVLSNELLIYDDTMKIDIPLHPIMFLLNPDARNELKQKLDFTSHYVPIKSWKPGRRFE